MKTTTLLGALAALFLTACATGTSLEREDLENLPCGIPRAAIVERFGEPQSVEIDDDGRELLVYSRVELGFLGFGSSASYVVLELDEDGRYAGWRQGAAR